MSPRPLLLALLCLLALPASAGAIVGGQTTTRAWPHMAAMELRGDDGQYAFRCGGSLVAPDVVLTAAHCVDAEDGGTLPAARLRLQTGTKKRSAGGDRVAVRQVVEHPDYDSTGSSDVALLKLVRPVGQGGTIRLAQPAEAELWAPGDQATVIGWGAEVSGGGATDDLKEVTLPLRSDSECAMANFSLQPATEFCAGNLAGGEDSCQGDSGGPIMVFSGATPVLIGAVSYGLGCALPTQYGVYAEAAGALRTWIESTTRSLSSGAAIGSQGGTAPAGAGGTATPPSTGPSLTALPVVARARLSVGRGLRISRRLRITLRTTSPLRSIEVRIKRGRRTLAVGRRASLRATTARITLRRRVRLTPGRVTLTLRAVDSAGKRVTVTRRVALRR